MVLSHHVRYGIWGLVSLLGAGLLWLGISQYLADQRALAATVPASVSAPVPAPAVKAPVPEAAVDKPKEQVWVHVAGAVNKPGVYRLESGARVADAISAAGGEKAEADLDALNLAEPVGDGQKVQVYTKAQVQAGITPPAAAPVQAVKTTTAAPAAPGGKLKLNTATEAQLKAVGLTPMAAKAVTEHIKKNGPLRSWEQVDAISGVGEVTMGLLKQHTQL